MSTWVLCERAWVRRLDSPGLGPQEQHFPVSGDGR